MASKKWSLVFAVIAIVLVLSGIAFLIIRDYPRIEGFAAAILDTPKCPDRYTFFNDKRGDSFCCAGQVDPYTHTCKGNRSNDLCSMKPNMKDMRTNVSSVCWEDAPAGFGFSGSEGTIPIEGGGQASDGFYYSHNTDLETAKKLCESNSECRAVDSISDRGVKLIILLKEEPKSIGLASSTRTFIKKKCPRTTGTKILPMCADMISRTHNQNQGACPGSLPNYASIGKCCAARPDLDGYDCRRQDNADKKRYCKISPPLLPGEQLCSNLQMASTASCPSGFAKMTYQLGDREVEKYGLAAKDVEMPICFGMDKTCIPNTIVKDLQSKGIYKDKDIDTWAYSCKGWETVNMKRDLTKKMDNSYI